MFTAVLQFLWSYWIVQCGVYFHPSDENLSPGAPGRKTPLDRIGFALHQLENRYSHRQNLVIADVLAPLHRLRLVTGDLHKLIAFS